MATCNNCGAVIPDGTGFCTNCGAQVQAETANNVYQNAQQSYQQSYAQQSYQQPYPMQNTEPVTSIGQYIGWMLIGTIFGPISFILTIVFACMGEKKNRANFFRAYLVIWAIAIVLSIIAVIVLSAMSISVADMLYDFT